MLYFGFDRVLGSDVYDDSGYTNNGELTSLATVTKTSGTCGKGLRLQGGESWYSTLLGKVDLLWTVHGSDSVPISSDMLYVV